jgi:hypothetical protein
VLDYFLELFGTVIGQPYSSEQLKEIYEEGCKRYEEKVPPGYKDLDDKKGLVKRYSDTVIKGEYGDLILWKQIINKSKTECRPIIFISDDVKEDWRENENGKKKPRKELIAMTGQEFLLYTTEYFLEDAKAYLSIDVKDATLTEVQDLQIFTDDSGAKFIPAYQLRGALRHKFTNIVQKQDLITELITLHNEHNALENELHENKQKSLVYAISLNDSDFQYNEGLDSTINDLAQRKEIIETQMKFIGLKIELVRRKLEADE